MLLAVKQDWAYVAGVKITESQVIAVLTDLGASVVARSRIPLDGQMPELVTSATYRAVENLRRHVADRALLGIGVGLAGMIDRDTGSVTRGTYFGWTDVPFAAMIHDATGLPAVIDNDVNTLALSEQLWGAGRGVDNFVVISIGRGIGMAMVLDGRIYRGAQGGAGEIGHIKVHPGGNLCACGGRGCLETVIGEPAVRSLLAAIAGRDLTVDEAGHLARAGEERYRAVFDDIGRRLGAAVAAATVIVNPTRIVLAGEGTHNIDLILPGFESVFREGVVASVHERITVHADPWDDESWARGAASLVLSGLFEPNLTSAETSRPSLTGLSAG